MPQDRDLEARERASNEATRPSENTWLPRVISRYEYTYFEANTKCDG